MGKVLTLSSLPALSEQVEVLRGWDDVRTYFMAS